MAHSFFDLAPHNELPDAEPYSYCTPEECGAYTDEEHDAIMAASEDLTEAFYEALNAYSNAHPGLSYGVVLHAIDCLAYGIRCQMNEDTADA